MITYEADFSGDVLSFSEVDSTNVPVKHLKPLEITFTMIQEMETGTTGATVEEVVSLREQYDVSLSKGTVRNHFTALKKAKRIDVRKGHAFTIHGSNEHREAGIAAGGLRGQKNRA